MARERRGAAILANQDHLIALVLRVRAYGRWSGLNGIVKLHNAICVGIPGSL